MRGVTAVPVPRALERGCLVVTACVALLASACDRTPAYRVSLRLEDGALVRTLAPIPEKAEDGTLGKPTFPEAKLAELIQLYGAPSPDGSFTGRAGPELAADLGGSATLVRQESPLGTVYVYRERAQGSDRPLELASEVQRAVDGAQALSAGWLQVELSAHPAASAALDAWRRERLLPDVGTWVLYHWLAASGLLDPRELEERFEHFIVEHGYVDASDLPLPTDAEKVSLLVMRRALQRKNVEIEAELDAALARLATEKHFFASLGLHVARSEPFRSWHRERGADPAAISEAALQSAAADEDSPEAKAIDELLGAYLEEQHPALGVVGYLVLGSSGPAGRIEMTLALSEPPLETNGTWDGEAREVRWTLPMRRKRDLSSFAYTRFTDPARDYQTQRFGRTVLDGKRLADYVAWRAALDDDERRIWDERVEQLRPGDDLRARIVSLRLTEPPTPSSATPAADVPASGASLLLEGFDAAPTAR